MYKQLFALVLLASIAVAPNLPPAAPTLLLPENDSLRDLNFTNYTWSASTDPDGQTPTYDLLVKTGPSPVSWWNSSWRYRTPVTVAAGAYTRINEVEAVQLNFSSLIKNATFNTSFQTASFDNASIRLVESNPGRIENITAPYYSDDRNDSINVALASNGAGAAASSTYSALYSATRLIDGDKSPEGKWAAADSPASPVKIDITLPRIYTIDRVAITNDLVSVLGNYSLNATEVQVSADGSTYISVGFYRFNRSQQTYTYHFTPRKAKFVRVLITSWFESRPEIREIEVFEAADAKDATMAIGEFHDTLDDAGKLENPLIFSDDFEVNNNWAFETNGSYTDGGYVQGFGYPEGPTARKIGHPSSGTVNNAGRIKKTFTVESGKKYTFTFWVNSNYGGAGIFYLLHRAWVDDEVAWEIDAMNLTGWVRGSVNFTASSTSVTIALGSQDVQATGGWGTLGDSLWDGFRLYGPGYSGAEIQPDGSATIMPAKLYMTDASGYPRNQLLVGAFASAAGTDIVTRVMDEATIYPYSGLLTNGSAWVERYDSDGNFNYCTYWAAFCDGAAFNKLAYSSIYFYVPKDYTPGKSLATTGVNTDWRIVRIRFGSDDSARFWIDGELKFNVSLVQTVTVDKYYFDVALRPGWHRLLAATTQGSGGWGLAYRFTDIYNYSMPTVYSLDLPYNYTASLVTKPISDNVFATSRADFTNGSFTGNLTATADGDLVLSPTYKDAFYGDWIGSESGASNYIERYISDGRLDFCMTNGAHGAGTWDAFTNYSSNSGLIKKVTFDYSTNYDNAQVLLELVNDTATFWSNSVYGYSTGATTVTIAGGTRFVRFRLRVTSGYLYNFAHCEWYGRVDNVRLGIDTPYGALTSRVFDTRYFNSSIAYVGWTENKPSNTDVAVKVRLGNRSDLGDATWASVTNGQTSSLPASGRYIQYFINLSTTDYSFSPTVSDIYVAYRGAPKNRWTSLTSYGLLPPDSTNLALGKTVTCDSEWLPIYGCIFAVDGIESAVGTSEWASANTAVPHSIKVDLGSVQALRAIRVSSETTAGYHARSYSVLVSNDSSTWYSVTQVWRTTEDEQVFYFDRIDARYVNISGSEGSDTDNAMRIYELQVFGEPTGVKFDILDSSSGLLAGDVGSPYNLSAVSATGNQLIRLRINLTTSDLRITPALHGYRVQWVPESITVLRLKKDSMVRYAYLNVSGLPYESPLTEVFVPNRDFEAGAGTDGVYNSSNPQYWLYGSNYRNDDATPANAYGSTAIADPTYYSEGRKSAYGYATITSPLGAYVSRREISNLTSPWFFATTVPYLPGTLVLNFSTRMRSITTASKVGGGNYIMPVLVNSSPTSEFPQDALGASCGVQSGCDQHVLYAIHEAPWGQSNTGAYNNYANRFYGTDQQTGCGGTCPEPAWYIYEKYMQPQSNAANPKMKLKFVWAVDTWNGAAGSVHTMSSRLDYPTAYSKTLFRPQNVKVDVLNDGTYDQNYSSSMNPVAQFINITSAIENTLKTCTADEQGYCTVYVRITSDTPGTIKVEPNISLNVSPYDLETPYQFDQAANYDASTNALGNLTWIMDGTTLPYENRTYHVYFDTSDNGKATPSYTARTKDTSGCGSSACTVSFGIAKSRNQYISAGDINLPANLAYSMGLNGVTAFKGADGWHNCTSSTSTVQTSSFSVLSTGAVYDVVRESKTFPGLGGGGIACDYRIYDGTDYVSQNCTMSGTNGGSMECGFMKYYGSTGAVTTETSSAPINATGRDLWYVPLFGRYTNQSSIAPSYPAEVYGSGGGGGALAYLRNDTYGSGIAIARYMIDDRFANRLKTVVNSSGLSLNDTVAIYDRNAVADSGLVGAWSFQDYEREYSNSSGLAALWHFDEGTGISTKDSSGNGNTGTLWGADAGWDTAGKFGTNALSLGGSTGYVDAGGGSTMNVAAGSFSICAWFKTTGTEEDIIANNWAGSNGNYLLMSYAGKLRGHAMYSGNANAIDSAATVNDGAWHHGCEVVDDTNISIYVDGALSKTQVLSGTKSGLATTVYIGARYPGYTSGYFAGTLEEVAIYNRSLSATEIREFAGRNARDSSGYADDGYINSTISQSNGRHGYGLIADGTASYVNMGTPAGLNISRPEISVEAWIKPMTSFNFYGAVLAKTTNNGWNDGYGLAYYAEGRGVHFWVNNYAGSSSAMASNVELDGGWYHVVGTYDGKTVAIYLNGQLVNTSSYSASAITTPANSLYIGGGAGSTGAPYYFWRGAIDEVRIYNRVLSPQEVSSHYGGEYPGYAWRAAELNVMLENPPAVTLGDSERLAFNKTGLTVTGYNSSSLSSSDAIPSGRYWWSVRANDGTNYTNRYSGWASKFTYLILTRVPSLQVVTWNVVPLSPARNDVFWVNATVKCLTEPCGTVNASSRYGYVTPDTLIPISGGPMHYTSGTNPVLCTSMGVNELCSVNLPVVGTTVGKYYVNALFNSSSSNVAPVTTQTKEINIVPIAGSKCNIFVGAMSSSYTNYTDYVIRVSTTSGRNLVSYRIRVCWAGRYTCSDALHPQCSTGTCPVGQTCQKEQGSCVCR